MFKSDKFWRFIISIVRNLKTDDLNDVKHSRVDLVDIFEKVPQWQKRFNENVRTQRIYENKRKRLFLFFIWMQVYFYFFIKKILI